MDNDFLNAKAPYWSSLSIPTGAQTVKYTHSIIVSPSVSPRLFSVKASRRPSRLRWVLARHL